MQVKSSEQPASIRSIRWETRMRRRPVTSYSLFQIPLIGLPIGLTLWLFSAFLGWGQPPAVAIALDLSGSTYFEQAERFNQSGTISFQEIQAVRSYLHYNSRLKSPPQSIQILGFGAEVAALTEGFQTDSLVLEKQLDAALNSPNLADRILPNTTLLNGVIKAGTDSLSQVHNRRRSLLIVTDGRGDISQFYIDRAIANRVRINAIVVGGKSRSLEKAVRETGGTYRAGDALQLEKFFRLSFFESVFTQKAWQFLGIAVSCISSIWILILPLDRWILQDRLKLKMYLSGQISLWFAYGSTAVILVFLYRDFVTALFEVMSS